MRNLFLISFLLFSVSVFSQTQDFRRAIIRDRLTVTPYYPAEANEYAVINTNDSTRGVIFNRVSNHRMSLMASVMGSSEEALIVYNKDDQLYYFWTGTAWQSIGSGEGGGISEGQVATMIKDSLDASEIFLIGKRGISLTVEGDTALAISAGKFIRIETGSAQTYNISTQSGESGFMDIVVICKRGTTFSSKKILLNYSNSSGSVSVNYDSGITNGVLQQYGSDASTISITTSGGNVVVSLNPSANTIYNINYRKYILE